MQSVCAFFLGCLLISGVQSSDVSAEPNVKNVVCPDMKYECPDGSTCCYNSEIKQYKCCNLAFASCCSDGEHCCPQGYTCIPGNMCKKSGVTQLALQLFSRPATGNAEIKVCPDKKHYCNDEQTCCRRGEEYGCCSIRNAVCCSDNEHCCKPQMKCDLNRKGCVPQDQPPTLLTAIEIIYGSVVCPDGKSTCLDGSTCCVMTYGNYGCCDMMNAVCCTDGRHCCPQGFACDGDRCTSLSVSSFLNILGAPVKEQEKPSKNIL